MLKYEYVDDKTEINGYTIEITTNSYDDVTSYGYTIKKGDKLIADRTGFISKEQAMEDVESEFPYWAEGVWTLPDAWIPSEMTDMIYDTIMGNTQYEQFNPNLVDDQEVSQTQIRFTYLGKRFLVEVQLLGDV